MKRINSIDFVRGLVMVIMALDHTRDLVHLPALSQDPTNLATTTPLLFFTRWITHLCAPIFVFLSGSSAYLSFKRKGNIAESRNFLLSRGLWLIVLEFTIITFGIFWDIHFQVFLFQVIATIGVGFIFLALLLKIPAKVLGCIGLAIICLHNILPLIPLNIDSVIIKTLLPFFAPMNVQLTPALTLIYAYPPIPWLGIMLLGFGTGRIFELPFEKRKRIFLKVGVAAILLFMIVRFSNFYGDPLKWTLQKNAIYTFLSFINLTKYPPSLLYCLITLGIMCLLLAFFENAKNRFVTLITVYGKVPLFYYLIHWYIAHIIMFALLFMQGFNIDDMVFKFNSGRPATENGLGLGGVYLVWIGVVIILYPLCKWYGTYKDSHKDKKWLSYL